MCTSATPRPWTGSPTTASPPPWTWAAGPRPSSTRCATCPAPPPCCAARAPAAAPGSLQSRMPHFPERSLLAGPEDAPAFVAERGEQGVDYVKITAEVPGAPGALSRETLEAVVRAARAGGAAHGGPRLRRGRLRRRPPGRGGRGHPCAAGRGAARLEGRTGRRRGPVRVSDARHDGSRRGGPRPPGARLRPRAGERRRPAPGRGADPRRTDAKNAPPTPAASSPPRPLRGPPGTPPRQPGPRSRRRPGAGPRGVPRR